MNRKLNLRRILIAKINFLIYTYKNIYDLDSIWFNQPIEGIIFYRMSPHYSETEFLSDWDKLSGVALLEVFDSLKNMKFSGKIKMTSGSFIKVKPKVNAFQKRLSAPR